MNGDAAAAGPCTFTFAGRPVAAQAGDSLAMALWAAGIVALRRSSARGEARGLLCNMGICYECLVRCNGEQVRACMTPARAGLVVEPGGPV